MIKKFLIFSLVLIFVLSVSSAVFAEEGTTEIPACTGEQVEGTVVEFDLENQTATIDTGDGLLCMVSFNDDFGHPITTLLGNYFETFNLEDYADDLAATEVCLVEVVLEETTEPVEEPAEEPTEESPVMYEVYTGEGDCPGMMGKVVGKNEDGTFLFDTGETEPVSMLMNEESASLLGGILDNLMVNWGLNEDGSYMGVGDQIGAYHDDGFGFGVIVKLYGMAMASIEACMTEEPVTGDGAAADEPTVEETCGLDVAELFQMFEDGTGMGQLFKLFGKPSLLGVGHVRHDKDTGKDGSTGICNALEKGGKANGHGNSGADCGETDPGYSPQPANNGNKNKDKEKTNNGKANKGN